MKLLVFGLRRILLNRTTPPAVRTFVSTSHCRRLDSRWHQRPKRWGGARLKCTDVLGDKTEIEFCLVPGRIIHNTIGTRQSIVPKVNHGVRHYPLHRGSIEHGTTLALVLVHVILRSPDEELGCHTVKNIHISMRILWRVLHMLTEPVPYNTLVTVYRRKNEARAHTAMLKYGKLATKHPWIYGYCLQCATDWEFTTRRFITGVDSEQ